MEGKLNKVGRPSARELLHSFQGSMMDIQIVMALNY